MSRGNHKVGALFVAGTRPEIIKMAPVVKLARERLPGTCLVLTGQHQEMANQALAAFSLKPDLEFELHRRGTGLGELTSGLVQEVAQICKELRPGVLVVQGDTSSAAMAGLVASYMGIPVAHIEAGLRSHDKEHPFPEEINRRVLSVAAEMNFAPTPLAAKNLLAEGVTPQSVVTTGNTVVDALEMIKPRLTPPREHDGRRILVTTHRRESWDQGIRSICSAVGVLAKKNADVEILLPVHQNPVVHDQVHQALEGAPRVQLTEPLDYLDLLSQLQASYLVLTDSGGIQEEAPSFGVPVLVLRGVTERPEAVEAGQALVVGTDQDTIIKDAQLLLDDPREHDKMARVENPFGDGQASQRIVEALERFLAGDEAWAQGVDQFKG